MKLVVLYRPKLDQTSAIEAFMHDFQVRHEGHLEAIDVDSREGIAMATLYDVVDYPTILALRDDGSVLQSWVGNSLPLMDELAYYASAGS